MTDEAEGKPSYGPVHAVQRVLSLLRVLNKRGVSTVDYLHRETGLPKPTIVRMLETLIVEGYVSRDKRQGGYLVTALVQSLSCGFHDDPLVVEAGRPWASAITRRFKWPVSIALLERTDVVVRFSTVIDSPMSPEHATINMRLSLIDRAMGLTYLAFCSDGEREILLHMLESVKGNELRTAGGRRLLEARLVEVRKDGFAMRSPRVKPLNSGTLAVPIIDGGRVLATMGMGYFRSAVPIPRLVGEYVPILRDAADKIVAQVHALRSSTDGESAVTGMPSDSNGRVS